MKDLTNIERCVIIVWMSKNIGYENPYALIGGIKLLESKQAPKYVYV